MEYQRRVHSMKSEGAGDNLHGKFEVLAHIGGLGP